MVMADEDLRLRVALRDLVALSTIPAGWIGIEPRTIATGLADILAGSLGLILRSYACSIPPEG